MKARPERGRDQALSFAVGPGILGQIIADSLVPCMLARFVASILKLIAASFAVGVILSMVHITHADVLARFGMTPDQFVDKLQGWIAWAIPKIGLGAFIVVPVWLLMSIIRPPKSLD